MKGQGQEKERTCGAMGRLSYQSRSPPNRRSSVHPAAGSLLKATGKEAMGSARGEGTLWQKWTGMQTEGLPAAFISDSLFLVVD